MEENDTFLDRLERISRRAFFGTWVVGGVIACSTPLYDSYRSQTPLKSTPEYLSTAKNQVYQITPIEHFNSDDRKNLEDKLR